MAIKTGKEATAIFINFILDYVFLNKQKDTIFHGLSSRIVFVFIVSELTDTRRVDNVFLRLPDLHWYFLFIIFESI